ncbi:MAG: hypothetical protein R3174_01735 [Gammaproteobacteria bacterium]|nr:hypothetical protein [Gammaproteobacteria bacterium]
MLRICAAAVLVLVLGSAPGPARADIVGALVNKLMDTILRGGTSPPPPDPGAHLRHIPEHAKTGVMSPPEGRLVKIDGEEMLLAPGAKIRDTNNRIVLPATVQRPVTVRYTMDNNAQVHLVWLVER